MTHQIFLTGDRSLNPLFAVPLAAQTLMQVAIANVMGEDIQVVTGDNTGFEEAVRGVLEGLGATPNVIPTGVDDDGKPAWDTRHEVVNASCERILFVHSDPLDSRIGASLMRICPDKVEIPELT